MPVIEKAKAKSKSKAKYLLLVIEEKEKDNSLSRGCDADHQKKKGKEQRKVPSPVTPIVVMQGVGIQLGIPPPENLTKEQLEADPSESEDSDINV
jgi:hypothetical protein